MLCWIRMETISRTDRWKNEDVWQRVNPTSYITQIIKIRKASCIDHILHSNCLLKHVTEDKVEVMGRRGRKSKQLMDDLKERRRYSKLKGEALDRTVWRTCFGRDCGPVVRQTAEWWWRGTYAVHQVWQKHIHLCYKLAPIQDVMEENVTAGYGTIFR